MDADTLGWSCMTAILYVGAIADEAASQPDGYPPDAWSRDRDLSCTHLSSRLWPPVPQRGIGLGAKGAYHISV